MNAAVRPYRPDLHDALFAFYARCFPRRDMDGYERAWRWQYFENPSEPDDANRIWIVTRGAEVVAHLGTMAARVKLNGEMVRGRWSSDLMVDERYCNGGLGVWLIREWTKSCDVALAKGLSSEVIQVYRRMGWHTVPIRHVAQLPLTLRAATGRVTRNRLVNAAAEVTSRWAGRAWAAVRQPRNSGVEFRTVESFPEETDQLTDRIANRAGMTILRNRGFLQWRYLDCPVRRYSIETAWRDGRLIGYAVFSVRPERGFKRGIIHDLEIDPSGGDDVRSFLAHCVRRMDDAQADEVAFLPRSDTEQDVVASLGFASRSRPDMMMLDVRSPDRNPDDLIADCNVQLGDGDDW